MARHGKKVRVEKKGGATEGRMTRSEEADEVREGILTLWRELPREEQERLMIQLLRTTDVGRRIAGGGLPFIPGHMWERTRGAGNTGGNASPGNTARSRY